MASRPSTAGLDARVTSLDLSGFGFISALTVASDGTRVVCTQSGIYTLPPTGLPTLLAGHITEAGFTDGQGGVARFHYPSGIAMDGDGNVIVADSDNHALQSHARWCRLHPCRQWAKWLHGRVGRRCALQSATGHRCG